MLLPALFHWSPTERRELIEANGLRPYCPPAVSTGDLAFPYLCFSPTPSSGWGLSGDMHWVTEIEQWDLWQVRLAEGDEVHVRGDFGPVIREVRVYGAIPADRCWYVATREPACARPITEHISATQARR
jgi:hypothetical protein